MEIVIIGIVVLIVMIAMYNSFVSKFKVVEKSKSTIDVYLTQRFNLIPNLVEVVKGYSNYEKETLEKLIKIRESYNAEDNDIQKEANLNNQFNTLIARVESYPELKANENYLELQKQLVKMESQIQAARRIYNMDVEAYNVTICKFPNSVLAGIFGFKEAKFFEATASEQEVIDVNI